MSRELMYRGPRVITHGLAATLRQQAEALPSGGGRGKLKAPVFATHVFWAL